MEQVSGNDLIAYTIFRHDLLAKKQNVVYSLTLIFFLYPVFLITKIIFFSCFLFYSILFIFFCFCLFLLSQFNIVIYLFVSMAFFPLLCFCQMSFVIIVLLFIYKLCQKCFFLCWNYWLINRDTIACFVYKILSRIYICIW